MPAEFYNNETVDLDNREAIVEDIDVDTAGQVSRLKMVCFYSRSS